MSEDAAIVVRNAHKEFRLPHQKFTSLKQNAIHLFSKKTYSQFTAVEDVSFEVKKGEFFSIMGRNGSGKSTLLKMLAGIYVPTSGEISINGQLSPFIELGVGFNPELSARDNIFLNGAILGLSRKKIEEVFDEVLAFAELEEFVDQKLKNFSSGMQVRLAFSIAIQARAEILLIDEVLAVGDANFQAKCFDVFRSMKAEGKTIVFVSHDVESVREFSDRVMVMDSGNQVGIFKPDTAIAKYSEINRALNTRKLMGPEGGNQDAEPSEQGQVLEMNILDKSGKPARVFSRGDDLRVSLAIANPAKEQLDLGVSIKRSDDFYVFGTNTGISLFDLPKGKKEHHLELLYPSLPLQRGSYYLVIGLFVRNSQIPDDYFERTLEFHVEQHDTYEGLVYLEHSWELKK